MDDQNTPSEPVVETPVQAPEPPTAPVEPESSQPNGSMPTDMPPEAPEAPKDAVVPVPVEDQNGGVNQPENEVQPAPALATLTSSVSQTQSPAQQDQTGFIRMLLAKANAKLGLNRQKKLDRLMLLAQKKQIITNDDVQKLLRVSDATATRYLVKLVGQGRLAREGSPRDAKYQFVR